MYDNKIIRMALVLLGLFTFSYAEDFDIRSFLSGITKARFFPADLPDSPPQGITRNQHTIVIPGQGGTTVTVTIPDTICGGTPFIITAVINNATGTPTPNSVLTLNGLVPGTDVTFNSVASISPGTTFTAPPGGTTSCPGIAASGGWNINAPIPAGETLTIELNCTAAVVATSTGLITTYSQISTNAPPYPPGGLACISNTYTIVPSPTTSNFTGSTCNNSSLSGTLSATGGTPPYNFSITSGPSHGSAVITNPTTGAFTYTPNASFSGVDSFNFAVSDSNGCVSNTSTANITALSSPTSIPKTIVSCTMFVITDSVAPLVSGGTPPYTFSVVGTPVGGTVVMNSVTGDFVFTLGSETSGTAYFVFAATDANGCTTTNTYSIVLQILVPNIFVGPYQIIYASLCT